MDDRKHEDEWPGELYTIERTGDGGFKRLESVNEKVGVRMSIAVPTGVDDRPEKKIEAGFFRPDGSNVSTEGEVKLISTARLLGMGEEKAPEVSLDFVKEVVTQRYVTAFQRVISFTDYDDLVRQVFPDLFDAEGERIKKVAA